MILSTAALCGSSLTLIFTVSPISLSAPLFLNHDLVKIPVPYPVPTTLTLTLMLLALSGLTLKHRRDEVLSNLQTRQIKGIAILLVVLNHLSVHTVEQASDLFLFQDSGYIGVILFLILSGFGIAVSLNSRGTEQFWLHRLIRVGIPVLLAMLLEIALSHLLNLSPDVNPMIRLSQIFFDLQAVDRNLWFIPFLFFWYFVAYILFQTQLSPRLKYWLLFGMPLLLFSLPNPLVWKMSAFGFPVGYWLGEQRLRQSLSLELLTKQPPVALIGFTLALLSWAVGFHHLPTLLKASLGLKLVALGLISLPVGLAVCRYRRMLWRLRFSPNQAALTLAAGFVLLNYNSSLGWESVGILLYSATHNLTGIVSFAAVTLLLTLLVKCQLRSLFLAALGSISFEIYLLHGMFMYKFDFMLFRGSLWLTFPIYLAAICAGSCCLQRLSAGLANRCLAWLEPQT